MKILGIDVLKLQVFLYLLFTSIVTEAQLNGQAWEKTTFPNSGRETQFMQIVDNILYAVCNDGIWALDDVKSQWSQVLEGGIVSTFLKHNNKYYIGLWTGGVYQSSDMRVWTELDKTMRSAVYKIVGDGPDIYVCTGDGIFKWDSGKNTWGKEKINNDNIHNKRITNLAVTDKKLIAFACDQLFEKDKSKDIWQKLDFKYNYCVSEVLIDNNQIYFSTTGEGIYLINPGNSKVTQIPINTHKHVQKIQLVKNKIVKLYHKGIYEDGAEGFHVSDDVATDIIEYKSNIYISTAKDGIFYLPSTAARTIKIPELNVVPNPSTGQINYCLKNSGDKEYEITIVDLAGRVIINKKLHAMDHDEICNDEVIHQPGEYILMCTGKESQTSLVRYFTIVR